jgi:hypothetical protein
MMNDGPNDRKDECGPTAAGRLGATLLALVVHAGLLAVCFTAVYVKPEDGVLNPPACPLREQAALALLAALLLAAAVGSKLPPTTAGTAAAGRQVVPELHAALLLGLGLGVVYGLRFDPVVLDTVLPEKLRMLDHTLADVVVPLLGLACLGWACLQKPARPAGTRSARPAARVTGRLSHARRDSGRTARQPARSGDRGG